MKDNSYWACLILSQVHATQFESQAAAIALSVLWLGLGIVLNWSKPKEQA